MVLAHKHPDDRAQVAETIDDMLHTHRAFSTRHRILDTGGVVHHVVVVGDQLTDHHDVVIGTHRLLPGCPSSIQSYQCD